MATPVKRTAGARPATGVGSRRPDRVATLGRDFHIPDRGYCAWVQGILMPVQTRPSPNGRSTDLSTALAPCSPVRAVHATAANPRAFRRPS